MPHHRGDCQSDAPIRTRALVVRPLLWAILLAMLSGCSGTSILNTLTHAAGYRSQQNIAYGAHARQKLDVYQPRQGLGRCVVMFVYGGSWEEGSKDDYGFVGAALARRGYTVLIPDYHVDPDNPPTLIVHASDDEIVTPRSADSLAEKLTRAGVSNTRLIYDSGGHVRLVAAMGRPLGFLAPTLDDVDTFLQARCSQI